MGLTQRLIAELCGGEVLPERLLTRTVGEIRLSHELPEKLPLSLVGELTSVEVLTERLTDRLVAELIGSKPLRESLIRSLIGELSSADIFVERLLPCTHLHAKKTLGLVARLIQSVEPLGRLSLVEVVQRTLIADRTELEATVGKVSLELLLLQPLHGQHLLHEVVGDLVAEARVDTRQGRVVARGKATLDILTPRVERQIASHRADAHLRATEVEAADHRLRADIGAKPRRVVGDVRLQLPRRTRRGQGRQILPVKGLTVLVRHPPHEGVGEIVPTLLHADLRVQRLLQRRVERSVLGPLRDFLPRCRVSDLTGLPRLRPKRRVNVRPIGEVLRVDDLTRCLCLLVGKPDVIRRRRSAFAHALSPSSGSLHAAVASRPNPRQARRL